MQIDIDYNHDQPGSWQRLIQDRNTWSSTLVSFLFHTLVIILLALWWMRSEDRGPFGFIATVDAPVALDDGESLDRSLQFQLPDFRQSLHDDTAEDVEQWQQELAREMQFNETPLLDVNLSPAIDLPMPHSTVGLPPVGGGLSGRQGDTRAALAAARGGSEASESAVELGLAWLAEHQWSDGGWSFHFQNDRCNGKCSSGGTIESRTAATGLALLSFLGAGYTHQDGKYRQVVDQGLKFLLNNARKATYGSNLGAASPGMTKMYSHGIATMALCEALALTRDEALRPTATDCIRYIINAQHQRGGWRYEPRQPGDTTVTGWQLMALKSAEMAGIDVPTPVWTRAGQFLDSVATSAGSRYGYTSPGEGLTTTSIGLLMRMYLGWDRLHGALELGASFVAGRGPSQTDMYFNYYTTLALHHIRNDEWERWNPKMRDYLVQTQERNGHERGSWHFHDHHGQQGGRLYTTCMAIMTLEVYYRYLPLYGWPEDWPNR